MSIVTVLLIGLAIGVAVLASRNEKLQERVEALEYRLDDLDDECDLCDGDNPRCPNCGLMAHRGE